MECASASRLDRARRRRHALTCTRCVATASAACRCSGGRGSLAPPSGGSSATWFSPWLECSYVSHSAPGTCTTTLFMQPKEQRVRSLALKLLVAPLLWGYRSHQQWPQARAAAATLPELSRRSKERKRLEIVYSKPKKDQAMVRRPPRRRRPCGTAA